MGVALDQAALHQYHRDGTNQFQIPSIAKQSQLAALLEQIMMVALIEAIYAVAMKRCPALWLWKLTKIIGISTKL